jgi:hypothetical protein
MAVQADSDRGSAPATTWCTARDPGRRRLFVVTPAEFAGAGPNSVKKYSFYVIPSRLVPKAGVFFFALFRLTKSTRPAGLGSETITAP